MKHDGRDRLVRSAHWALPWRERLAWPRPGRVRGVIPAKAAVLKVKLYIAWVPDIAWVPACAVIRLDSRLRGNKPGFLLTQQGHMVPFRSAKMLQDTQLPGFQSGLCLLVLRRCIPCLRKPMLVCPTFSTQRHSQPKARRLSRQISRFSPPRKKHTFGKAPRYCPLNYLYYSSENRFEFASHPL